MLSDDTRARIVQAYARYPRSSEKVGEVFGVSGRTVRRLAQQMRETGSLATTVHNRGRRPALSPEQLEQVRTRREKNPDIHLKDLIEELHLPISVSGMSRLVRRLDGSSQKK